jgi:hypothetical protein
MNDKQTTKEAGFKISKLPQFLSTQLLFEEEINKQIYRR